VPSAQPDSKELSFTHKALDTVSRQAAIDEIEERKNANGYCNVTVISELNRLEGYIMRLPSAQPEIIHCKECKFLQKWRSEESAKKFGQIYECLRDVLMSPLPDDFCSKGKRRTDG
jgi:hypothetical protein